MVAPVIVMSYIFNLQVTVVAWSKNIFRTGGSDLIKLSSAIGSSVLGHAGLEKTATTAAAVIGTSVGLHVDEVFFTHQGFSDKTHIFGNGLTIGLLRSGRDPEW